MASTQLLQHLPPPPLDQLVIHLLERRDTPPDTIPCITRQLHPLPLRRSWLLSQVLWHRHKAIPRLLFLPLLVPQQLAILLIKIIPVIPRVNPLPKLTPLLAPLLR